MDFTLEIPGIQAFEAVFSQAPVKVEAELQTAIQKSALTIVRHGREEAPVDQGTLRSSIAERFTPLGAIVSPNVPYAVYVHEGTGQYARGQTTGRIKHGGIRPNPFMERAMDNSQQEVYGFFGDALDNVYSFLAG
jgi:hypothetical protein